MSEIATDLFDVDDLLGDVISPAAKTATTNRIAEVTQKSTPCNRRRAKCPANTLFFDLETIPDYSRESLFGLGDLPQIPPEISADLLMPSDQFITQDLAACKQMIAGKHLPAAWCDQVRAAENSSKKPRKGLFDLLDECGDLKNKVSQAQDDRRKTMSITPEYCRIVSFGWAISDEVVSASTFGNGDGVKDMDTYERCVLKKFWELAKRSSLIVGYNHVGFDLPAIYARSALLGIEPSKRIDLKPWGGDACDIMQARWPRGGAKKLKDFAKSVGIPIPAGDVDGSQVETLLKTDPAKLAEYNRSDVSITRELYLMYRGFYW